MIRHSLIVSDQALIDYKKNNCHRSSIGFHCQATSLIGTLTGGEMLKFLKNKNSDDQPGGGGGSSAGGKEKTAGNFKFNNYLHVQCNRMHK
uniref:Uncharacterized protein n=1 Tax=Globodera rostochiensis TaxID=31243 RepID=A0A914HX39_GLORO